MEKRKLGNSDLRSLLHHLGSNAFWSENDDGKLYTVVSESSAAGLKHACETYDIPVDFHGYPGKEAARKLLKESEKLEKMPRFRRVTLLETPAGFNPLYVDPTLKPAQLAIANAKLDKIETCGANSHPYIMITMPRLVARAAYKTFPKELRSAEQKANGELYWKFPECRLTNGNNIQGDNIRFRSESLYKNDPYGDIVFHVASSRIGDVFPDNLAKAITRKHGIRVPLIDDRQYVMPGMAPEPWIESAQKSKKGKGR